jgi:cephalosporin hydroxylase
VKYTIDTARGELGAVHEGGTTTIPLYSREGFELLSALWLKVGWNQKYPYTFSWFGRPIIQLPDDLLRLQEVIYALKPDVILETGIAHGGSLVFHASLCRAIGKGRVVGVDIEIRPHNRRAIEAHPLAEYITMIEGSSIDPAVVAEAGSHVRAGQTVLVLLDSNHTRPHVRAELEAYHGFVSVGSYIVATDGIMRDVADTPRGQPGWVSDNPVAAAEDFVRAHPDFVLEQPAWPFNESGLANNVTHWPQAYLRRSR